MENGKDLAWYAFAFAMFVFGYLIYILIQALFINGIKASAAGKTEVMPNGKEKDGEMILYWLAKLLERHEIDRVYYVQTEFSQLIKRLKEQFPGPQIEVSGRSFTLPYNPDNPNDFLYWHNVKKNISLIDAEVKISIRADNTVVFYKEYKIYKFNKYFRKPIIQCIICMGSFWTLPTFWLPTIYFFGFHPWVVYLGIINTFCVSYANYLIYKKV